MMLYDTFDEFLFAGILPEKLGVCPFVLSAVFCDLGADFVEVVVNFHRIFLDISVIADFIVGESLWHFYFFLFSLFFHSILLFLHTCQHLLSFLLINIIHFILNLHKSTDNIMNRTDDLVDRLNKIVCCWLVC